ncbi:hypothetical protein ABT214_05840 [Micromonospora purpureochromogenes]|uniref:hypothetical protein n=1 Tax=Micromonospora purpureochromogenes TaxID=47872 RepID=UPI003320CA4F
MTHEPSSRAATAQAVPDSITGTANPGRLRGWWGSFVGAIGALVGLVPHVLHHVGALAGTALVAGAGGTSLFGVIGLVASVPLLLRLHRRFASWWAPAIALAVFAAMFSLSTFVIGPAISGVSDAAPGGDSPAPTSTDHNGHHDR